ncbi:hypothetical protein [Spongiimicrobium sp. 3-5]|uniref:hypothetical protein n=1 Tax=Spongiimicrobium sp. 3-5 TaxID=3332596 RepID=UPI0039817222
MFKSVAHFIISFLLIASILAPSVVTLLDNSENTMWVVDFNEEEKKKEEKKELVEKDFFLHFSDLHTNLLLKEKIDDNNFRVVLYTDYATEILLPPPEHTI